MCVDVCIKQTMANRVPIVTEPNHLSIWIFYRPYFETQTWSDRRAKGKAIHLLSATGAARPAVTKSTIPVSAVYGSPKTAAAI